MKIRHHEDPRAARASSYGEVGDQLDAIMKMADALAAQGVALPQETLDWIEQCKGVKTRFPARPPS